MKEYIFGGMDPRITVLGKLSTKAPWRRHKVNGELYVILASQLMSIRYSSLRSLIIHKNSKEEKLHGAKENNVIGQSLICNPITGKFRGSSDSMLT